VGEGGGNPSTRFLSQTACIRRLVAAFVAAWQLTRCAGGGGAAEVARWHECRPVRPRAAPYHRRRCGSGSRGGGAAHGAPPRQPPPPPRPPPVPPASASMRGPNDHPCCVANRSSLGMRGGTRGHERRNDQRGGWQTAVGGERQRVKAEDRQMRARAALWCSACFPHPPPIAAATASEPRRGGELEHLYAVAPPAASALLAPAVRGTGGGAPTPPPPPTAHTSCAISCRNDAAHGRMLSKQRQQRPSSPGLGLVPDRAVRQPGWLPALRHTCARACARRGRRTTTPGGGETAAARYQGEGGEHTIRAAVSRAGGGGAARPPNGHPPGGCTVRPPAGGAGGAGLGGAAE